MLPVDGLRASILVVLASCFSAATPARSEEPAAADRFEAVKEWRLSFEWEAEAQSTTGEGELRQTARVSLSGHADYHLVRSEEEEGLVWRQLESEPPRGGIRLEARKTVQGPGGDGTVWTDRWTRDAVRFEGGSAGIQVDAGKGTYELAGRLDYEAREDAAVSGTDPRSEKKHLGVSMTARDDANRVHPQLPATGLVLSGTHEFPQALWPFEDIEPGVKLESWALLPWTTMRVSWTAVPWRAAGDEEMVLVAEDQAAYEKWLPAPPPEGDLSFGTASTLKVRAKIRPKTRGSAPRKGRIEFRLDRVTTGTGLCGNFPHGGKPKDDLRFLPSAGLRLSGDSRRAWTEEDASEAVIEIEARDPGAWGKLTAECASLGLRAEDPRTGRLSFTVPLDDDGNRIADAWEKERRLPEHFAGRWDEESVPGQQETGDGLSLYREYRGFVVLENGKRVFRRLDPLRKELFVIDKGGSLDTAAWESASGITALLLDDDLVNGKDRTDGRIVDFNYADGSQHAVRIETMPDDRDPGGLPGAKPEWFGYEGDGKPWKAGHGPKNAEWVRIFPSRIRDKVDGLAQWLERGLSHPESPDGAELTKWLDTIGVPRSVAEKAGKNLGEDTRARLARQIQTGTTIHELGHACGLPGHVIPKGQPDAGNESSRGSPRCPMSYPDDARETRFIVLQPLFARDDKVMRPYSRFCDFDPKLDADLPEPERYNCWRRLNPRD